MFYCEIFSIGETKIINFFEEKLYGKNKNIKFFEGDQFCFGFLGCGFSAPGGLTLTTVEGEPKYFLFAGFDPAERSLS